MQRCKMRGSCHRRVSYWMPLYTVQISLDYAASITPSQLWTSWASSLALSLVGSSYTVHLSLDNILRQPNIKRTQQPG
jgi:hypothetical protein